jgi:lipopolysaccharide transport system permease protein
MSVVADTARVPTVTVIRPRPGWIAVDWRELIEHRELLYFLMLRDLKARYKQTVLGVAWAVLQPLFTTIIFTVVFGLMTNMPSDGVPYLIFSFAGQWPWTFFANAVSQAGTSLMNQQALLTKIYLPRVLVPASYVVGGLLDMAIASVVMAGMLVWYRIWPGWGLLALPGLIVLVTAAATGTGLILAALTASYRDFRHLIPFMLNCWLFLTPLVYPLSKVSEKWRWLWELNPVTGIVQGFRSALLGLPWDWTALGVSCAASAGLLVFGLYYFRRTERRFADVL